MPDHHDSFFKKIFSDKLNVADFSKHVLPPELVKNLDLASLHLENTSYVDEELAKQFSDVVYSCVFNQSEVRISLLFEHKSFPDRNLPYQILKYMVRIWNENLKQKTHFTPIIPIVLYHGKKAWQPEGLKSVFNTPSIELLPFIPDFQYIFIDLSRYTDEDIKLRIFETVSLKMALLILKNIFNPGHLEQALEEYFGLGRLFFQNQNGLNFLETVIKYLYLATEIKTHSIIDAVDSISKQGGVIAMTTAEKLRQEGRLAGRKEGRKEELLSFVRRAHQQGLAVPVIARIVQLDDSIVESILNNEDIDIPLHLLDSKDRFG
ncbi:Rpn family recombination-promoting nuclease/putative transposase [Desulfobacter latus]|uniref:Rpn family recombination-promoting nuclease/putative transposase n=1 Tax=Desulfobacter latus TaxID=2292 RepID=A0A850T574_9BACT|nr:Rpn family recombination-promoting nuclease/putative transposase [Desulfobacter latus]NWH06933.1 Rpn family recombination-promoting nuclease/putative transposase [Desulfobacter latus]